MFYSKMKVIYIVCIFLLSNVVNAQIDHQQLDNILKLHVTEKGEVQYSTLKPKIKEIESILKIYAQARPSTFSKDDRLAYYINVYNLSIIFKILQKYPIKSIKELNNGNPWDDKFITIEGKKYSLNDLENTLIRPVFKDPRIHFALNCGAKSCPILLNEAYKGAKLGKQLDTQTQKFINNKKFNVIEKNKVNVSKLFDWYKDDFGNVCDFLNKYSNIKVNQSASISYLLYDWTLNGK